MTDLIGYFGIFVCGVGFGVAAIAWLELTQIDRQRRRRERDRKIIEDPASLYRNDPPAPRGTCEGCGVKHPHLDADFCDGCMTAASERF